MLRNRGVNAGLRASAKFVKGSNLRLGGDFL